MTEQELVYAAPGGDWSLYDLNGYNFTHRDMKGHYYLLFFGHTLCPEATPLTVLKMTKAIKEMQKRKESQYIQCRCVFVSVKPDSDQPHHLKEFKNMFDPASKLVVLRGKSNKS